MGGNTHIQEAVRLMRGRYRFRKKAGVSVGSKKVASLLKGDVCSVIEIGQSSEMPPGDFCVWISGFVEMHTSNRAVAEAKLAEVSYSFRTMFFSAALGRPVAEMLRRHTRYENVLDIGDIGGQRLFMCW